MKYFSQFLLLLFALAALIGLQFHYWMGENGRADYANLQTQIEQQQQLNYKQQKANTVLQADVDDLKTGLEAVEEHARLDLGLIKVGETFVQMSTASTGKAKAVVVDNAAGSAVETIPQPLIDQ